MRSAWKLRVAGCDWPGLARGRQESTMAASCSVVAMGASARACAMRRAMRRLARSSPKLNRISASSASLAVLTRSAALGPSCDMRMSSGPSRRKEKPRSGLVELHRGDPEIEHHAVEIGAVLVELREDAGLHHQPVAILRRPGPRHLEGQRVAVDGDDPRRAGVQQRAGIAAGAERAVEPDTRDRRQRRQQRAQQHGGVGVGGREAGGGSHAVTPPPERPVRDRRDIPAGRNPRAASRAKPRCGPVPRSRRSRASRSGTCRRRR